MRSKKSQSIRLSLKARQDPYTRSKQSGWNHSLSGILFYSGLQWIRCGPLTFGQAICFILCIYSNVNRIQNFHHRHTQNNIQPWEAPLKLTQEIKITIISSKSLYVIYNVLAAATLYMNIISHAYLFHLCTVVMFQNVTSNTELVNN